MNNQSAPSTSTPSIYMRPTNGENGASQNQTTTANGSATTGTPSMYMNPASNAANGGRAVYPQGYPSGFANPQGMYSQGYVTPQQGGGQSGQPPQMAMYGSGPYYDPQRQGYAMMGAGGPLQQGQGRYVMYPGQGYPQQGQSQQVAPGQQQQQQQLSQQSTGQSQSAPSHQ